MASEIDERAVADYEPLGLLAEDSGLDSVVADLAWNAADRLLSWRENQAAQCSLFTQWAPESEPQSHQAVARARPASVSSTSG